MSSEPAHTPQRMPRADEGASAPLTEPRGQADHLMRERRLSGVEAEQAVESYEEYMIGRHLMMFDNFSVEVKGYEPVSFGYSHALYKCTMHSTCPLPIREYIIPNPYIRRP